MSDPWHTKEWFTSPWNFDESITGKLSFADELVVHEVTLRDGEQQAGVQFSTGEKVTIAHTLAEAGVQRIEAGMPAVSRDDELAIREIVREQLPSEIYAFARCMISDVELAADCGVDGVVLEIPSSHHLIELGYRWSVERAIELSVEATRLAHKYGLKIAFFPIDATRASLRDFLDIVRKVSTEGHMDSLGLVDTFGVLTPHAVASFVDACKEFGVPLETHFHMDYGMGVANTVVAAAHGASVIQTTVGGIGERAGNAPLEETIMALLTLYGVDVGVDTRQLKRLHDMVMAFGGIEQPGNRPVTGNDLFKIESGIPATFYRNTRDVEPVEAMPFAPALVGQGPVELVLGKGSGPASVDEALQTVGCAVSEPIRDQLTLMTKQASMDLGRLLTLSEFRGLVARAVQQFGQDDDEVA